MKIKYFPKYGKYHYGKRVFWSWDFYHLKMRKEIYLLTPIGGFRFDYF